MKLTRDDIKLIEILILGQQIEILELVDSSSFSDSINQFSIDLSHLYSKLQHMKVGVN